MENERIEKIKNIQQNAVNYSEKFPFLLLTFATGVGKTLTALKIAINDIEKNKDFSKWTIAIEETSQISSWNQEFIKHNLQKYRKYFDIITYASIKKNENKKIILDECHHAISNFRISNLKSHKPTKIVALSATMDKFKKDKLNQLGVFKQIDYPLKKAIKEGILPTPKIKVHLIELNDDKPTLIYKKNKGGKQAKLNINCSYKNYLKDYIYSDYKANFEIRCTEKEFYKLLSKEIDFYKKQYMKFKHKGLMFKWLNYASKRKRFVSEQKTNVLSDIIKTNKTKKRYIVFCGSIDQAKSVELYDNIIHSKKNKKENEDIIYKFNKKRISSIFCVNKLREGVNLYHLDFGIITQIDSKSLSFIQMVGRALRSEKPIVHLIITKNTKDYEYYEKIKKEIGEEFFQEIERTN